MFRTSPSLALVRGVGEIASAIAHRLVSSGAMVVMHDDRPPVTIRRLMAFSDAIFDGKACLEGVTARRAPDRASVMRIAMNGEIPIIEGRFDEAVASWRWDVLVDARMNKRRRPERQIGLAPLVIGLGPGCAVGVNVDVAIETSWENLGAVLYEGETLPLRGEPRSILGLGRERCRYAPEMGVFLANTEIGNAIRAGDLIGAVGRHEITASFDGVVRGITRSGVAVEAGTKIAEIDPRRECKLSGIDVRPRCLGDAVCAVVRERAEEAAKA